SLAALGLGGEAEEELFSRGLALASAVKTYGKLAGFIGLGRKMSGTAFTADEATFLDAIATQAGLAIERTGADTLRLGRYRLERRAGTGGMAELCVAWQLGRGGFERRVALKRPLPHLNDDAEAVAMSLDEARLSAQLQHRNIAQVFEVDQHEGKYFIAM